ncbi:lysylphosphatidylglycerol synthase domain-containing protein [Rhizobium helianthi]|uniref:Lysylphosphatidylglycerol synthase domain-containing protein n=1 Tax=Rhizobium helianthi TaxID=1132695 RepID=A0ABW4M586_9HYPH
MTISPRVVRKSWIKANLTRGVSLAAVALYAVFIQWFWGWRKIFAVWQEAGWAIAGAAVLLLLLTYVLRTWRIYDYFPAETKGRFRRLMRLVQVHNLLNIMLPFRSGEVSFPLLMKEEFGVTLTRATSALLVMRFLDLHALLAAAGIGLALEHESLWGWLLWLLFALLPLPAFLSRQGLFRVAGAVAPPKLYDLMLEAERGLPINNAAFCRAWGVTLINWLVKVAVMAWVLILLAGLELPPAFGGGLGGELSSVLPFHAPGGVGTYPAGIVAGALALGAPTDSATLALLGTAAVNAHLLIIFSSVVGTLLSILIADQKRQGA